MANTNDVIGTVAYMKSIMSTTMKDLPKKNKQDTAADTLTKANYETVTMNIIKEFIDIFHSQQVETDLKFAELKAEIMLVKTEIV